MSITPSSTNAVTQNESTANQAPEDLEATGETETRMDPKLYRYATTGKLDQSSCFWAIITLLQNPFSVLQKVVVRIYRAFLEIFERLPYMCTTYFHSGFNIPSEVESLLRTNGDKVTLGRNTVLHLAASVGNTHLVTGILGRSQNLLTVNNCRGDSPLHVAARGGHLSTVRCLVEEYKAEVGEVNAGGNTALHLALENHHKKVAKFLVEQKGSISHSQNKSKKTPLCMAAEAGIFDIVQAMVDKTPAADSSVWEGSNGYLILRAAVVGRNHDILKTLSRKVEPAALTNVSREQEVEDGMHPLTLAAYIGNLDAVRCLLEKYSNGAYRRDTKHRLFPIYIASRNGNIKIVQEFLNHCPDLKELHDDEGRNILHVAAAYGRDKMVEYMLGTTNLEMLFNEKDNSGNTPLHIAVQNWHPKIVRILTRDKRVHQKIVNNKGMTAFDIAEKSMVHEDMLFRWKLTFMALRLANAPHSDEEQRVNKENGATDSGVESTKKNPDKESGATDSWVVTKKNPDYLLFSRENVSTLLIVSTLVAAVTFAAGFTVPGGYKNSGSDEGMATLRNTALFQIFLVCNTISMYSSITVAIALVWAQTAGDLNMICVAMRTVLPMLGLALIMMSMAFLAGGGLVAGNLTCGNVVVALGSIFIGQVVVFILPLTIPLSSKNCITHLILRGNFRLLMRVTRYDVDSGW